MLGSMQLPSSAAPSSSPCFASPRPQLHHQQQQQQLNGTLLGFSFSDAMGALAELSCRVSIDPTFCSRRRRTLGHRRPAVQASLTELPILCIVRTCVFYALMQAGIAGRHAISSPSSQEAVKDNGWLPGWLPHFFGKDEEADQARELKKVRSRWQTTTKGTLKRRYRVPTKSEGRRLLNAICSLLSEDDTFRDATSHKGCQIRRENAHAESVCCYNVRALLDELPTPHLVFEITPFPIGPITDAHYEKAEKIEKVLRTGISI